MCKLPVTNNADKTIPDKWKNISVSYFCQNYIFQKNQKKKLKFRCFIYFRYITTSIRVYHVVILFEILMKIPAREKVGTDLHVKSISINTEDKSGDSFRWCWHLFTRLVYSVSTVSDIRKRVTKCPRREMKEHTKRRHVRIGSSGKELKEAKGVWIKW